MVVLNKLMKKNSIITDVNHFWVFKSPSLIPRAIINRIEILTISNDRPYAIKIYHQGNVNWHFFFFFLEIFIFVYKIVSFNGETLFKSKFRFLILQNNWISNKFGNNENTSIIIPIPIENKFFSCSII